MNVKLRVIQGRSPGKSIVFPLGEYIFGRGPECHIQPNSDWVSRQHCLLRVTQQGVFVRDLGSRNGTLVNGVRLMEERRMGEGDQLQVGPLVFEIHSEGREDRADRLTEESSTIQTIPAAEDTKVTLNETASFPRLAALTEEVETLLRETGDVPRSSRS